MSHPDHKGWERQVRGRVPRRVLSGDPPPSVALNYVARRAQNSESPFWFRPGANPTMISAYLLSLHGAHYALTLAAGPFPLVSSDETHA